MCCCWMNGHFLLYLSLSCVMWRNGCALAATQQNVTLMSKVLLNRYSPQTASVHVIPSSDDIQWKFKKDRNWKYAWKGLHLIYVLRHKSFYCQMLSKLVHCKKPYHVVSRNHKMKNSIGCQWRWFLFSILWFKRRICLEEHYLSPLLYYM